MPDWVNRQSAIAAQPLWPAWDALLHYGAALASLPGRVSVTGSVDPDLLAGPLIVVANHIGDFDAIVLAPSLYKAGIRPRFLATRGLMTAKVVGPLLERAGFIRVDRGSGDARHAITVTDSALANNGHIVSTPRVGSDSTAISGPSADAAELPGWRCAPGFRSSRSARGEPTRSCVTPTTRES